MKPQHKAAVTRARNKKERATRFATFETAYEDLIRKHGVAVFPTEDVYLDYCDASTAATMASFGFREGQ